MYQTTNLWVDKPPYLGACRGMCLTCFTCLLAETPPAAMVPTEGATATRRGSFQVFRRDLKRSKCRRWGSCSSTSEAGGTPRTSWCRLPGKGDVLLISEQYKRPESSNWYNYESRRAEVDVCNPDFVFRNFLKTERGFVWVEVASVRV